MSDFLFYLFSALTVLSAFMVTVSRNAVNGAMYMIVSFVGMAAMFVLLEAYFLAALQVLVYAGAVMVLFLFIIMLLDGGKGGGPVRPDRLTTAAACIGGLLLIAGLAYVTLGSSAAPSTSLPAITEMPQNATMTNIPFTTASRSFGYGLFTKYMLPFQVTGFLLLIAMIGVIILSKKIDATGDEPTKPRIAK